MLMMKNIKSIVHSTHSLSFSFILVLLVIQWVLLNETFLHLISTERKNKCERQGNNSFRILMDNVFSCCTLPYLDKMYYILYLWEVKIKKIEQSE